jgi:hypothetical protein
MAIAQDAAIARRSSTTIRIGRRAAGRGEVALGSCALDHRPGHTGSRPNVWKVAR